MEMYIKDNGKIIWHMVLVCMSIILVLFIKVIGIKTHKMVLVFNNGRTIVVIKDHI